MRRQFRWLAGVLAGCLFLGFGGGSFADEGAMEQLISIFEKKGVVTPEEAQKIRESVDKERERLRGREQVVEERERSLQQREQALRAKEDALGVKAGSRPSNPADLSAEGGGGPSVWRFAMTSSMRTSRCTTTSS